jgi:hypothetical protein
MNEEIIREYKTKSDNKVGIRSIRPVTQRGFFIFIGIIIFSASVGKRRPTTVWKAMWQAERGCILHVTNHWPHSLHGHEALWGHQKLFSICFCWLSEKSLFFLIMPCGTWCPSWLPNLMEIGKELLQHLFSSFWMSQCKLGIPERIKLEACQIYHSF